jgi:hypothetical protein
MNCFTHGGSAAIGMCVLCQKAVCRECVGRDAPRVFCRACAQRGSTVGFEYTSASTLGSLPLVHVAFGFDAVTMRPRIAKGVVAIGNVAVGGVAVGGLACGLVTLGGGSIGLLLALGGAALGLGVSIGGVAVGSVALGGVAIGFAYALGGVAFAPAAMSGYRCDEAAIEFARRWFGDVRLPPNCR